MHDRFDSGDNLFGLLNTFFSPCVSLEGEKNKHSPLEENKMIRPMLSDARDINQVLNEYRRMANKKIYEEVMRLKEQEYEDKKMEKKRPLSEG